MAYNYRDYGDYFFNRENLYIIKRYYLFLNHVIEVLSNKINSTFIMNSLLFTISILHILILSFILILLGINPNNASGFAIFLFLVIGLVDLLYSKNKYEKQTKMLYRTLLSAYSKEIDIYLFLMNDLKNEYIKILPKVSIFGFNNYNLMDYQGKTKDINSYINDLAKQFNFENNISDTLYGLHRLHFNTKYDDIYSDTRNIDPFFVQTHPFFREGQSLRKWN